MVNNMGDDNDNKVEVFNSHKRMERAYTPQELVHELQNLVNSGDYDDFMILYLGDEARGVRFGSTKDRKGFGDTSIMSFLLNITLRDLLDFF